MDIHVTAFKDVRHNERVLLIVRRHWFILLRDVVGVLLLFLIPFFILPAFFSAFFTNVGASVSGGIGLFFSSLWALVMWNLLFVRWTDYYYDIWVITDQRIIDVNQNGLFHRDVATLIDLNHIQDIKVVLSGIIGNILSFGAIQVQTAGTRDEFVMEDIANPARIEKILREAWRNRHELELELMGKPRSEV